MYKLSQKIRPKYSILHTKPGKISKKMEFPVQISFSISKNLSFYLKVQTHTDQCDREYMTQHQIQGKVRNNLPPIPKNLKSFEGTRTHAHTFRGDVFCHLSHEHKFCDFQKYEVRQYLYPFSSVGSSRWSGQIRKKISHSNDSGSNFGPIYFKIHGGHTQPRLRLRGRHKVVEAFN